MTTILLCLAAFSTSQNPPPTLKELAARRRLTIGPAAPIDLLKANGDDGKFPETLSVQFNLMEPAR